MPEITDEMHNNRLRVIVKIKPGERVKLCRCMASKTYPLCDGAHKNAETPYGPFVIEGIAPDENPPSAAQ